MQILIIFNSVYWGDISLIKLDRFQVYSSMTHHLYIVLCAHHPKSSLLPSPCIRHPFAPYQIPTPSPMVSTVLLSVSASFCLLFFCSLVASNLNQFHNLFIRNSYKCNKYILLTPDNNSAREYYFIIF